MKRMLAMLFAVLMVLGLAACGVSESAGSAGEEQEGATAAVDLKHQENEGDLGDYHIKFTGFELAKDYDGNDALLVHYDFTNNSEDTTSACVALYVKAFQNGVELEPAFLTEDYGAENELKDIRPGTTLDITEAFVLTDTTTVELEATELISLSDDMVVATYEFTE